jgi:hypothetical protein
MSGAEPRASSRGLLKKLDILPVPCQYILSLMLFTIDNSNNFKTGLEIHGLHTRNKDHLYLPGANLASVQKRITYSGINIFNSITYHRNDSKTFKNELYRYLSKH